MVLVALQDGLLDATFSELQAQFPKQTFRKVCAKCTSPTGTTEVLVCTWGAKDASVLVQVGVNLGKTGYLEMIAEATADIDVQILFCNAGYMLTGFFENTCAAPIRTQLAVLAFASCICRP